MKNYVPVIFIIIAVLLAVAGQILVKKGLNIIGNVDFSSGVIRAYLKIFLSPLVVLGSITYTASIFFWLYALSKVDLSFAYPFLALSYVFVLLFAWIFLGETVSMLRVIGVLVICLGIYLVARS